MKDFPSEVFDTYLHDDKRETFHYEFITEALWKWLKERYGCDHEVKRFYNKQPSRYAIYSIQTQVESRFKLVPVMFLKGEDLLAGKCAAMDAKTLTVMQCSMSQNHTYSNFKKRLVDILDAAGTPDVKVEQIRIWLSSDKKDLAKSFKEIANAGEKMQQDSGTSLNGKFSADFLGVNHLPFVEDTRI